MLPGRTDNAVKNRFHATERARNRNDRTGLSISASTDCYDDMPIMPVKRPKSTKNSDLSRTINEMDDQSTQSQKNQFLNPNSFHPMYEKNTFNSQQPHQIDVMSHIDPNASFVPIIESFPSPGFPDVQLNESPNQQSSQSRRALSPDIHAMNGIHGMHDIHDIDLTFLMNDSQNGTPMMMSPQQHGLSDFPHSPMSHPDIDEIDWMAQDGGVNDDGDQAHNYVQPQFNSASSRSGGIGCGSINIAPQFSMMNNMCGLGGLSSWGSNNRNAQQSRMQQSQQLPAAHPGHTQDQAIFYQQLQLQQMQQQHQMNISPSSQSSQSTSQRSFAPAHAVSPPLNLRPVPGHPNLYYNPAHPSVQKHQASIQK